MLTRTRTFITSLILMSSLFLYVFLQLYISSPTRTKESFFSQAAGGNDFGFNIHSLPLLPPAQIAETLSMAAQCSNTSIIRFWGFSGGDNIGKVLANSPTNMKFVIALSDYYKAGVNQPWPAAENDPIRWFSSEWKTNGYKDFIDTVTKKYSNNPKILIWELMNEPNCSGDLACNQAQHQFFREASAIIAQNSPNTMISPGTQGQNTGGEHFDNGDFDEIASMPDLTALSCHIQIGDDTAPLSVQKQNCITALQITKKYDKFFYTGEFGKDMHCTEGCVNTCDQNKLTTRKNEITSVLNELNNLGNNASIVWQFSPEQNSTLSCDGASVFPKDPFCSITGQTTLNDQGGNGGGTTAAGGNAGATGGTTNNSLSINFNPQNPLPNTAFTITTNSNTTFGWVYMKIFKQGDTNPFWVAANNLGDEPSVKNSAPFAWTYHINLGKPTTLPGGEYKVTFYSDCDKGCSEKISRNLSIGPGKTNPAQATPQTQTNTQTNNQGGKNTAAPAGNQGTNVGATAVSVAVDKCPDIKINGLKNSKYSVIFLGSGYQNLADLTRDVLSSVGEMYNTNLPENEVRSKINYYVYPNPNIDANVTIGEQNGLTTIFFDPEKAMKYAQACGGNGFVILVNSSKRVALTLTTPEFGMTAATNVTLFAIPHELGHSIALLNDEYQVHVNEQQELRSNCKDQTTGDQNTACPGWENYQNVGCFQTCSSPNWYRSTNTSIMNGGPKYQAGFFNPPSVDEWIQKLQNFN